MGSTFFPVAGSPASRDRPERESCLGRNVYPALNSNPLSTTYPVPVANAAGDEAAY